MKPLLLPRGGLFVHWLWIIVVGVVFMDTVHCNSESYPVDLYVQYCPDDHMCSSPFETYSKSASRCSCHPLCKSFKDCCYDTDLYNEQLELLGSLNAPIFEEFSSYNDYFRCTTDIISSERYWMISECPSSWEGTNKCQLNEGELNYTVGNLTELTGIPVVSENGITFRNIFCAICHGQELTSLTPWSITAECLDLGFLPPVDNLTLQEKVEIFIGFCQNVTFAPPADHPFNVTSVIPCRSQSEESFVQSSCPDTEFNDEYSEGCRVVFAPLSVDYSVVFRNRYCAECFYADNPAQELTLFEFCPVTSGRECYFNANGDEICIGPPPGPPLVPISITFDFFGDGSGVSISSEQDKIDTILVDCEEGQVFDPTSSTCLQLHCRQGYILESNRCIPNATDPTVADGLCEEFLLTVTFTLKTIMPCTNEMPVSIFGECLPEELVNIITAANSSQHYTCGTNVTVTRFSISQTISLDEVKQIFSSGTVKISANFSSSSCQIIDAVEILNVCSSSLSSQLLCTSPWQTGVPPSDTLWNRVVSTEEDMNITRIRFRRTLKYLNNNSVVDDFSLQRCKVRLTCPLVSLNSSLFVNEGNNSDTLIFRSNTTVRFTSDEYSVNQDGMITVCNFLDSSGEIRAFLPSFTSAQSILSTIGITLSIIGLSFSFLTYSCFSTLRTRVAPILIMVLCFCLIIAQCCLLFAGIATSIPMVCSILAGVGHFFWLSAFSSSCIFGFTLQQTFSLKNQTVRGHKPSCKKVATYVVGCFLFPSLISGALLVVHLTDRGERYPLTYGNEEACWIGDASINLIAFGVPVLVSLLINLFFFSRVVYALCIQHNSSRRVRGRENGSELRELLIYIKIFVILSLTWIVGYFASFFNQEYLWYIFIILTSLQGVFIFLAFIFKSEVFKMWKEKLTTTSKRRMESSKDISSQHHYTESTTF
ncbi:uncharacterized protein [Apostichopus japonicus]|uniref:uncharacterized protein n=1 Tax=Stichopus japonicus TaxID=307972 RepID=UPI003AB3FD01